MLQVSSTETPLRDGSSDFGYNVEAARAYHARGPASPHSGVPHYAADIATSDMITYRQSTYPYSSKSYYSAVSGWGSGTYGEDDYGLNYSSYPHMSQEPVHMVPAYRYTSSSKTPAVYVDPESPTYSYGNLVHRPATGHDPPALSLSGMAAPLPTPDRLPTSNRTLPSTPTYRTDGLPGQYSSGKASVSHSSDVGYAGPNSSFDSSVGYGAAATLSSSVSSRSGHSDASAYQSASGTTEDGVYCSDPASYRTVHGSDSYIYSGRLDSGRRESHPSGGANSGSVLSNGQVYVPDTQSHAPAHSYSVSAAAACAASQPGGVEVAMTAAGTGGGSVTSRAHAAEHRRSAGSLRGA